MKPQAFPVAALCLALWASAPRAQPTGIVDLADPLTDAALFRLHGSSGDGRAGVPVAAGDLDGDGAPDFALAAFQASPLGRDRAGTVFVHFGDGSFSGRADTADPAAGVLAIHGAAARETAGSELWVDDVTGDGIADLLIGRQNYSPDAGRPGAGGLSVLAGGPQLRAHAGSVIDLGAPPAGITLLTLHGAAASDRFGIWFRSGDIDGDGIADVVVAADQADPRGEADAGTVFLVRGGGALAANGDIDVGLDGGTQVHDGLLRILPPAGAAGFHFGSTCGLADLDGDGRPELLLSAALARAGAGIAATGGVATARGGAPNGRLYIVWNDTLPADWRRGATLDLAQGVNLYSVIRGASPRNTSFGEEAVGDGDFDGDGAPDLFVGDLLGDYRGAAGNDASGSGHVLFNAPALRGQDFRIDAPPSGVTVTTLAGAGAGDIAGDAAIISDFNGDGLSDLAVAAPHATAAGRVDAGTVTVLFGQPTGWPATVDLQSEALPATVTTVQIFGAHGSQPGDQGDVLAYSVMGTDLDGDGRDDLVLNEMTGNGLAPGAVDVGNLILLRATQVAAALPVSEPPAGGGGGSGGSGAAFGSLLLLLLSSRRRR